MSSSKVSKATGRLLATVRKRKTRSMKLNSIEVPSLKEFIQRHRVLKQYRDFLRALKVIPDEDIAWRIKSEIQDTFRSRMNETDKQATNMAVIDGDRKLTQLQAMVGYDRNESESSDSWLNIKDDVDKRGRIGNKWPWE